MNWPQFLRDTALGSTAYMSYKTTEGVKSLNTAFEEHQKRVEAQLIDLGSDIKRGFATMSYELAVHSEIYKNILNVLQNKLKTEAEELKQFGLTALRNGWIDDAIRDFHKSLEINRYDYQVYYLLAKCYDLTGNQNLQNKNLELAYHYSTEDSAFRLYIALDIVASLVNNNEFDEARQVIQYVESSITGNMDLSPLLLAKVYIDVFNHTVDDATLNAISEAMESYQGDDPSKIMTIILVLSQHCDENTQKRIENLFNLKKLEITERYGKKVLTHLGNIAKFLQFIEVGDHVKNVNLTRAPLSVRNRFFPAYHDISTIRKRIQSLINAGNALSVEQFNLFIFLMSKLFDLENDIIKDIEWMNEPLPSSTSFNENPYSQAFIPNYDFKIENDKILIQLDLNGALLTLTMFKVIIVDTDKKTYQYDIFDDYLNLSINELNRDVFANDTKVDLVSFYIRDRISDKILQASTSLEYAESYVINGRKANCLDLFVQRAENLLEGYLHMSVFNSHLELLTLYLDMLGFDTQGKITAQSPDASAGSLTVTTHEEIEFLD